MHFLMLASVVSFSLAELSSRTGRPYCRNQAASMTCPDSHYLPPGYHDALGDPISEQEYFHQVDYEQKHGIPYARDREREKTDTKKPLSLLAHPEMNCDGDIVARITESHNCYRDVQDSSIFVDSLPSNCKVVPFEDGSCSQDPFDLIPFLSYASGCYTTDAFSSVRVDCRPLPA